MVKYEKVIKVNKTKTAINETYTLGVFLGCKSRSIKFYRVCQGFRLMNQGDYFLITFEASCIFEAAGAVEKIA